VAFLGVIFGALVVCAPLGKARAVCDEAVDTLLHSQDLVEVTRAGFIVQRFRVQHNQAPAVSDAPNLGLREQIAGSFP
jgi:hypothetical protein